MQNNNVNDNKYDFYKTIKLKYTKFHWCSGSISTGDPSSTSIELVHDQFKNEYIIKIKHCYFIEKENGEIDEAVLEKEEKLENAGAIINEINAINLKDLRNNYFSNNKIEHYSHWELEYDLYFKISGTYDSVPKEINEIIDILDLKKIISNMVEETKKLLRPLEQKEAIEKNQDTNKIYETISNSHLKKKSKNEIPKCPKCGDFLAFEMPDGRALYCFQCDKYFINNNGIAGEETSSPYKKGVLY